MALRVCNKPKLPQPGLNAGQPIGERSPGKRVGCELLLAFPSPSISKLCIRLTRWRARSTRALRWVRGSSAPSPTSVASDATASATSMCVNRISSAIRDIAAMRTKTELTVNRCHVDPCGSQLRQIPISNGLVIERSSSGGSRAGSCERSGALSFASPDAAASRS